MPWSTRPSNRRFRCRQSICCHSLGDLSERLHSKRKRSAFSEEIEDMAESSDPTGHQDKGRERLDPDGTSPVQGGR